MPKETEEKFDISSLTNGFDPVLEMLDNNNNKIIENEDENEDQNNLDKKEKKEEGNPNKKPNKDDSIRNLREQRDKLDRELKEAREKISSLEEFTSFKEVRDYLKQKTGKDKITEEEVRSYIAKNKDRKEKLVNLEKNLSEKESKIKELSIEQSDEWNNVFVKGIKDSVQNINVTVANFDAEGKPRAPELTNKFIKAISDLNSDGTPKNAIQIKSMLSAFKKEYFDTVGIDYESPPIHELVKAVESVHSSIGKANEARKNWDKTREQINKERFYNQEQERRRQIDIEKSNRDFMVKEYTNTDEFNRISEIDPDFSSLLKEEHEFMTSVLEDPSRGTRGYNSLVSSLAKAKMLDKVLIKMKELGDENARLKKQIESGRPPKGAPTRTSNSDESDVKGGIDLSKLTNGYDPLGDLN